SRCRPRSTSRRRSSRWQSWDPSRNSSIFADSRLLSRQPVKSSTRIDPHKPASILENKEPLFDWIEVLSWVTTNAGSYGSMRAERSTLLARGVLRADTTQARQRSDDRLAR